MKIIKKFQPKIVIFTAVKYCSILHGRVFVMPSLKIIRLLVLEKKNFRGFFFFTTYGHGGHLDHVTMTTRQRSPENACAAV